MEYFMCKVRYERTMENGEVKKVTEAYLVDAMSFSEAEKRIVEQSKAFISGEFEIPDIKKMKYSELLLSDKADYDRYYCVKAAFITLDEKTEKEKKSKFNVLVQAKTVETATENFKKAMSNTMSDYIIISVKETDYIDYFPYRIKD